MAIRLWRIVAGVAFLLSAFFENQGQALAQLAPIYPWKLAAFYDMNGTAGRIMQDSAGTHPGVLRDVGLFPNCVNAQCYYFNGKTSRALVTNAGGLQVGPSNLRVTLYAWPKKQTEAPAGVNLIRNGTVASGSFWQIGYSSRRAFCAFKGTASDTVKISGGPHLDDNAWHQIQCLRLWKQASGALPVEVVQLWVDGNMQVEKVAFVGLLMNSRPITVGADGSTSTFFGWLDWVRIETQFPIPPPA